MMILSPCGKNFADIASRHRFSLDEVQDVRVVSPKEVPLACLAFLFFLSRYAEGRTCLVVHEDSHGGMDST